jgi:hypothetical protein
MITEPKSLTLTCQWIQSWISSSHLSSSQFIFLRFILILYYHFLSHLGGCILRGCSPNYSRYIFALTSKLREGFQIWRVGANIQTKVSQPANKGRSVTLEVVCRAQEPPHNVLNYKPLNAVQYLVQMRRQMESKLMANSSSYGRINFPSLCKSDKAKEEFLRSEHYKTDSKP